MSASSMFADRDLRQREILPPEKLLQVRALVIGVGAIGRQVALQLAAVGVGALELVDHDVVAVENLAPQAYWPGDIGLPKVMATGNLCRQMNPDLLVYSHPERFRRSLMRTLFSFRPGRHDTAVFCCVDSMNARGLVWEACRERAGFLCDGRMSAEILRVLAVAQPLTDDYYPRTLFAESEAFVGSCTARSTVYTASLAAALMLSQFTKWLRKLPVERDVLLNLLAGEWTLS